MELPGPAQHLCVQGKMEGSKQRLKCQYQTSGVTSVIRTFFAAQPFPTTTHPAPSISGSINQSLKAALFPGPNFRSQGEHTKGAALCFPRGHPGLASQPTVVQERSCWPCCCLNAALHRGCPFQQCDCGPLTAQSSHQCAGPDGAQHPFHGQPQV